MGDYAACERRSCGFEQTLAEAIAEAHVELFAALKADGWEVPDERVSHRGDIRMSEEALESVIRQSEGATRERPPSWHRKDDFDANAM